MTPPRAHLVPTLLALAALACGSPAPEPAAVTLPTEPETLVVERWVAGTPTFVYAEGYLDEHRVATRLEGPWHTASLELGEGMELRSGRVHRMRLAVRDEAGRMDGPSTTFEVLEVLESRAGGPPTAVYPGVSVAGISVADAIDRSGASWGPFRLEGDAIVFSPSEVGDIFVDGRTLGGDATIEELAEVFSGCVQPELGEEEASRGRPASELICDGARLRASGRRVDVAITHGG